MNSKDLFLHALSRFRAAIPASVKEEWFSRHGYDLSLALHDSIRALAPSDALAFTIFFNKATNVVHHIALNFADDYVDFFGSSADQRVEDSIFEPSIEIGQEVVSSPDLLRDALNQKDYFSNYWDAPPNFQSQLVLDILNAAKDFS